MSGGISASTVLIAAGAAAVGAVAATALAPKPKGPGAPPAPEKPPQQAKAPEMGALRRQNQVAEGGPGMSSNSTLLTGPTGVNPGMLNLGRATLLGQ